MTLTKIFKMVHLLWWIKLVVTRGAYEACSNCVRKFNGNDGKRCCVKCRYNFLRKKEQTYNFIWMLYYFFKCTRIWKSDDARISPSPIASITRTTRQVQMKGARPSIWSRRLVIHTTNKNDTFQFYTIILFHFIFLSSANKFNEL